MKARKRFGQNFLTDEGVLLKIVDAIGIRAGDAVFEIGPGHGALTELIAPLPSRYVAVEIDRDLVPFLRARFAAIEFVNDDVLRLDLTALLGETTWRVVGNLPYNISSPLLATFTDFVREHPGRIADLHFMLQREMAQRLTAAPGSKAWGRLSVVAQLYFDVELLFDVAPESFEPAPKVWSSVVRLTPRPEFPDVDAGALDRVLRLAFAQRRKRLSNALKSLELDWQASGLDPGMRADNVTAEEYVALARQVTNEADE